MTVVFKLGSDTAGWPLDFEASTTRVVSIPTDGSVHIDADLMVDPASPTRSHISIDLYNYRQGS